MLSWDYIQHTQNIASGIIYRGQEITPIDELAEVRKFSPEFLVSQGVFFVPPDAFEFIAGIPLEATVVRFGRMFAGHWIYPIRMHNVIVGWAGWNPEVGEYTNVFFSHIDKRNVIQNFSYYNYAKKTSIIVEGITDSYRIMSLPLPKDLQLSNTLLGNRISERQATLLNRLEHTILIYDRDDTGRESLERWIRQLKGRISIVHLNNAKDIDQRLKENPSLEKDFVEFITELIASDSFATQEYFF